jgi:hypothetical protein
MTTRQEPNPYVMLLNQVLNLIQDLRISASGLLFSAFSRRIFHPRPQDGVFRCAFNKFIQILEEDCQKLRQILSRQFAIEESFHN